MPQKRNFAIVAALMAEGLVLANRFRLVAKLGEGGMGSVWKADDLTLDSQVAVKLIDPSIASSAEALGRFKREAQAAAALRSVHVVQILDYGCDTENGVPFIAMELLEGESLAARLGRQRRLSAIDTADILSQVSRALARAHEKGIVHRDLKPDNIYLVREGENEIAKVLDFGIAKRTGALGDTGVKTNTGAMLGTPYYMSPEQALGQPNIDYRTDIWSLGIIAYECLTGLRPFEKETLGALLMAICSDPLPAPSTVGPVPAGFDTWFARAAARKPEERFASAAEATAELRSICGTLTGRQSNADLPAESIGRAATGSLPLEQTGSPSSVTMSGAKRTRGKAVVAAAIAVVIVGASVLAWFTILRPRATAAEHATASTGVPMPGTEPLTVASQPVPLEAVSAPIAKGVVVTTLATSSSAPATPSPSAQPGHRAAPVSPASKREAAVPSAAPAMSAAPPRPSSRTNKPEDFGF